MCVLPTLTEHSRWETDLPQCDLRTPQALLYVLQTFSVLISYVVCSGEGLRAKQQQIPGIFCFVALGRTVIAALALESNSLGSRRANFSPCLRGRGTLGHPYHTTDHCDGILCMKEILPVSTGFSEQCY